MSKCKAIVKLFKNYHVTSQTLKSIQKENQGKESSLILPVKTRWGSARRCFDSLLHTKNCLQYSAIDDTISLPPKVRKQILNNDILWMWVQAAHNLLLSISVAVLMLEGDAPAISEVTVMCKKLDAKIIEHCLFHSWSKKKKSLLNRF